MLADTLIRNKTQIYLSYSYIFFIRSRIKNKIQSSTTSLNILNLITVIIHFSMFFSFFLNGLEDHAPFTKEISAHRNIILKIIYFTFSLILLLQSYQRTYCFGDILLFYISQTYKILKNHKLNQ